jgi:hypothetical protein
MSSGYGFSRPSGRKRSDSGLYLGMAVRAKKNAFRGFLSHLLYRPCEAAPGDPELLRLRIQVMEMQRANAAVIAADQARSARFCDEEKPCSPAPLDDALLATALTAVITAALENELRPAVRLADPCRELRKPPWHEHEH